jgi:sulfotransferase
MIHFISGLPRSGSTLLAAILRQNPDVFATMSGPVAPIVADLMRSMSGSNPFGLMISDECRELVLRSVVEAYYRNVGREVIFDTNRMWCGLLPCLARLFPSSKVICCVRTPAWILDSFERKIQGNALEPSKIFGYDSTLTVYGRVDRLTNSPNGPVYHSLSGLRQAWFSEHAGRIILVRYDSLVERPAATLDALYEFLNMTRFVHDFEDLEYDEPVFDAGLGLPGLHTVSRQVRAQKRITILPTDLFDMHNVEFWNVPGENPREVTVL